MVLSLLRRRTTGDTTTEQVAKQHSTVPTREEVVAAIIRDSVAGGQRCDAARAGRVVELFIRVSKRGQTYVLNAAELNINGGPHDVMAVVVPDVEYGDEPHAIQPGSAEDLLTRHVLDGQPGKRFIHGSDLRDGVRYCTVTLRVA